MEEFSLFTAELVRLELLSMLVVAMAVLGGSVAWRLRRRRKGRLPQVGGGGSWLPSRDDPPPAPAPGRAAPDLGRLSRQLAELQEQQVDLMERIAVVGERVSEIHRLLAGGGRRETSSAHSAGPAPPAFRGGPEDGLPLRESSAEDPAGASGTLADHAADRPAPRPAGLADAIAEFCAGRLADQQLIAEARKLCLRWGSTLARGAQRTDGVSFDTAENRVLVFQKDSHSSEFFLVLRSDAHWSFDLELIFDAHAPGGGAAERSRHTVARTLRPSLGRLEGSELVVTSVGEVEVRPR